MNERHEPEPETGAGARSPEETDPSASDAGDSVEGHARPTDEGGGPKGLEPTRYGDWERNGRCIDF